MGETQQSFVLHRNRENIFNIIATERQKKALSLDVEAKLIKSMFCIAEVHCSVLSPETGCFESGFCCLSEFLKANVAIMHQIRAIQLSATFSVIFHPPIILTSCNIQYKLLTSSFCLFLAQQPPPPLSGARASSFTRFLDHTQRRTIVVRTPLEG